MTIARAHDLDVESCAEELLGWVDEVVLSGTQAELSTMPDVAQSDELTRCKHEMPRLCQRQ
jgi:hypothetical protein